jgi:uncharacterized protein YhbP (UPF0306 family)
MMPTPREAALDYLQRHNVLTLATTGPEGVWAAAVFYVNRGFTCYFLSAESSRHSRNIAQNPQVAATVQEDYGDWPDIKGVQMEGTVRLITGAERLAAIARYGAKFPVVGNLAAAPPEIIRAMQRVAWYRLEPTRLYFIDNSQGFGHREEILGG